MTFPVYLKFGTDICIMKGQEMYRKSEGNFMTLISGTYSVYTQPYNYCIMAMRVYLHGYAHARTKWRSLVQVVRQQKRSQRTRALCYTLET